MQAPWKQLQLRRGWRSAPRLYLMSPFSFANGEHYVRSRSLLLRCGFLSRSAASASRECRVSASFSSICRSRFSLKPCFTLLQCLPSSSSPTQRPFYRALFLLAFGAFQPWPPSHVFLVFVCPPFFLFFGLHRPFSDCTFS